jgi:hypothetical protein
MKDEWERQGDFVIGEFQRYCGRKTLLHAETLEKLDRLA